ncbi:signal recognition particle protein [Rubrivirga sp.]|uniref:signal recognition particle protein n=1 Tax=Rubrivirga sp. TaxID=1885344 RepID=UPI003C7388AF
MFDTLSDKLDAALKSVKGEGKINDLNIAETMREVRRALLDADVNYGVAKSFTNKVREAVTDDKVLQAVNPGQQFVKAIYDELVYLLGDVHVDLNKAKKPPTVILVAGLQGAGKTTFVGKLALHLKSKGQSPMVAAADVYRPAAVDQLETLAGQVGVPVFAIRGDDGVPLKDAVEVARQAVAEARRMGRDTIIIDTAGRLHVDEAMMDEVVAIKAATEPDEILFVVDAMTGQDAVNTAKAFNDKLDIDGVVLTKLDGDTRGGAALSIRSVVEKPIKFAGTGEKLDALTEFYPDRMAQRILGMGDVVSFVEKAQEQFDAEEAEKLQRKFRSQEFDLQDFYDQLQKIKNMGSLKDLLGMIPGVGKQLKSLEVDDDAFRHIEALIQSMTPYERATPEKINGSRRRRIAKGAGLEVQDVNALLKQFREMKKLMKTMSKLQGKGRSIDPSALLAGR